MPFLRWHSPPQNHHRHQAVWTHVCHKCILKIWGSWCVSPKALENSRSKPWKRVRLLKRLWGRMPQKHNINQTEGRKETTRNISTSSSVSVTGWFLFLGAWDFPLHFLSPLQESDLWPQSQGLHTDTDRQQKLKITHCQRITWRIILPPREKSSA